MRRVATGSLHWPPCTTFPPARTALPSTTEHVADGRLGYWRPAGLLRHHPAVARQDPLRPGRGPAVVLWRPGQPGRTVAGDPAPGALAARECHRGAGQP